MDDALNLYNISQARLLLFQITANYLWLNHSYFLCICQRNSSIQNQCWINSWSSQSSSQQNNLLPVWRSIVIIEDLYTTLWLGALCPKIHLPKLAQNALAHIRHTCGGIKVHVWINDSLITCFFSEWISVFQEIGWVNESLMIIICFWMNQCI